MSQIPNFSTIGFKPVDSGAPTNDAGAWMSLSIPVNPSYGPADLAGLDFLDTYPGTAPYVRGPTRMYVNQPWTVRQCGLLDRRRFQRFLSP